MPSSTSAAAGAGAGAMGADATANDVGVFDGYGSDGSYGSDGGGGGGFGDYGGGDDDDEGGYGGYGGGGDGYGGDAGGGGGGGDGEGVGPISLEDAFREKPQTYEDVCRSHIVSALPSSYVCPSLPIERTNLPAGIVSCCVVSLYSQ